MQGEMENKMVADRRPPKWMGLRVVGESHNPYEPSTHFSRTLLHHIPPAEGLIPYLFLEPRR